MSAALLNQGKTAIRDQLKTIFTKVSVSDDSTAFDPTQTAVNPAGGTTTVLTKNATYTDQTSIDNFTTDYTITLDASVDTSFVGKYINTIALSSATQVLARIVRSLGIGFQTGDVYTVG